MFENALKSFNLYLENNPKVKIYFPQGILILLLIIVISYFSFNAGTNMASRGIETGFGFLNKKAQFDIQFSLIDYDGGMSYGRAYLVGLLTSLIQPCALKIRIFSANSLLLVTHIPPSSVVIWCE